VFVGCPVSVIIAGEPNEDLKIVVGND